MAAGIVDVFELVEVEEYQSAVMLVALGARDGFLQLFLQPAAVEETGERIVVGKPSEPYFGPLARGDVHSDRENHGIVAR